MDDDLERQVTRQQRELDDLTRRLKHEEDMRGFLQDRLERLERGLHGKISRAEAIGMLWIALPIVFCLVVFLAVGLVMSDPRPRKRETP
jgi:hypothetical protein